MRNLLSAYFTKMLKDRFFWLMECAIFLWTLYVFNCARHQFICGMHRLSKTFHTNPYFFNAAIWLGISLALYSAYFVGTEYHDGVLRSQIIAGHKRSVIYLSHYLIILLVGIIQAASYFVVLLTADGLFLGSSILRMLVRPAEYMLLIFLALLGYAAVFSCLSILLSNKAAIIFVQLLLAILMLYFGYATVTALLEPKIVPVFGSHYGNDVTIPNYKYLEGPKREIYEWADALVPSSMILHGVMAEKKDEFPFSAKIPVGTVLLCVSFTSCGLYGFSKKDLK